ncbi:hypothetical protein ACIOJE_03230 [Kitasatospora sp. NPDC087861]|uniref:hypothetical protein n=1 Tax=Kitasatospora sp. NPDC087861 TaxID=3364070 RepID=UPI0038054A4E
MRTNPLLRHGRRLAWLPAAALAAAALTGCSSSAPKRDTAAAPAPTTTAATTTTATTGTPTASTSAPTAASTSAAGSAGKRPDDACTLLTSPQVVQTVGTSGPFTGTHPDPGSDGTRPWGCTWGSRESYASIREMPMANLARVTADPELSVTPFPAVGQEAVLTTRKGTGARPFVYFVADGRLYLVEVTKSRAPGDEVNAPLEGVAETALAGIFAKRLGA